MDNFVFAVFLGFLKATWKGSISTPDLIKILYDAIADPIGLKNQKGDVIDVSKSSASKILNRTANVRKDICEHSQDKPVLNSIHSYFNKHIIEKLSPELHDRLIQQLTEAIRADNTMVEAEKSRLLKNADKDHITDFLAATFLYTLSIPNKKTGNTIGIEKQSSITKIETNDDEAEELTGIPISNPDIITQGIMASAQAMIDPLSKVEAYLASLFTRPDTIDSSIRSFCNTNYYHLIVTGCEIHGERFVDITLDRGLKYRGTAKEILERCADLSTEAVDELKSYPAIICNENTQQRGITDKNQLALLARVLRIRKGEKEYRIRFYPIAAFSQEKLNEFAVDFGLSSSGTLTTLNTSHWCVKNNNLRDVFEDTGIEFCRYILLYKSSILQSELPKDQTELLTTDFGKIKIGSYQTLYPSMWMCHLENDQVYRITTEFSFDECYIDGKRTIILSATWNNITITGKMSTKNWTSESYMNNCADAGKKTVTAIFKMLNYETNTVQYLLVFEVK